MLSVPEYLNLFFIFRIWKPNICSIVLLVFAIFVFLITQNNPLFVIGRPDDILMPVKAKRHGETIIVAFSRPVDSSQIQVFFIGDDDHEPKSVESSIGMRHAFKK